MENGKFVNLASKISEALYAGHVNAAHVLIENAADISALSKKDFSHFCGLCHIKAPAVKAVLAYAVNPSKLHDLIEWAAGWSLVIKAHALDKARWEYQYSADSIEERYKALKDKQAADKVKADPRKHYLGQAIKAQVNMIKALCDAAEHAPSIERDKAFRKNVDIIETILKKAKQGQTVSKQTIEHMLNDITELLAA